MIILSFSPIINRVKKSHFPLSMHAVSLRRKKFSAQCWSHDDDDDDDDYDNNNNKEAKIQLSRHRNRARHIHTTGIYKTGGMADECLRYHSRLAELLSAKKQESYATTISWVRAKVSFAILRSALLCLRGSRTPRRRNLDVKDRDLEIEKG